MCGCARGGWAGGRELTSMLHKGLLTLGVCERTKTLGLKKLQDGIIHVIQPDIQFQQVNSDVLDVDPQYVAIGQKKSSVYITGNRRPKNEPTN